MRQGGRAGQTALRRKRDLRDQELPWAQDRGLLPLLGKMELSPTRFRSRGLYLQLQIGVNLRPQQAEEVGRAGELEPCNRIR